MRRAILYCRRAFPPLLGFASAENFNPRQFENFRGGPQVQILTWANTPKALNVWQCSKLEFPKIRGTSCKAQIVGRLLKGHPPKAPPNVWKQPLAFPRQVQRHRRLHGSHSEEALDFETRLTCMSAFWGFRVSHHGQSEEGRFHACGDSMWLLRYIGGLFVGVLLMRALLFGLYTWAPEFWKLP